MPPPQDSSPATAEAIAAFLAEADLTAGLPPEARTELSAELQTVHVDSGDYLLRQGEAGDCLFLVMSGRLAVIADTGAGPRLVGRITPGAVVGELAVVSDTRRLASVVALRNSTLLRLERLAFDGLARRYPQLLRAVTTTVVQRLGERSFAAPARDRTVAVVGFGDDNDPAGIGAFAESLRLGLARYGETSLIRPDGVDDAELERLLHAHEERSTFVILTTDGRNEDHPWCLKHADTVLLVAGGGSPGLAGDVAATLATIRANPLTAPDTHVVLPASAESPRAATAWLEAAGVDSVFHVAGTDAGRVARFIARRAVGVVLGGGGARGFAHLGVLRALDEAGVQVDAIGGTSIGALLAAFYAMGWDADEREARARKALTRSGPLLGVTLPMLSLSSAVRLQRLLSDVLGNRRIEDLPIPFACVSADLGRAETVVHTRGPLALSVRASLSLPGVLPPVASRRRLLVDGGVLDNLPVTAVRQRNGGGPIIAVDIRPRIDLSMTPDLGTSVSGWSVLGRRRRSPGERIPSLLDVLVRSNSLGSIRAQTETLAADPVALLLRPPVDAYRILDFRRAPALIQTAYEDTVAALESAPAQIWA